MRALLAKIWILSFLWTSVALAQDENGNNTPGEGEGQAAEEQTVEEKAEEVVGGEGGEVVDPNWWLDKWECS